MGKPPANKEMVILAYRKGYRVLSDGTVVNAAGKPRKCRKRIGPGNCYYTFTVQRPGTGVVYPVRAHQLAALQKFGEDAFVSAQCVRHLNGDSFDNSLSNIAIGTCHDNAMDRDPVSRREHALRVALLRSGHNWGLIDADRAAGMSYRKLSAKYGVSLSTLSYHYGMRRHRD